MHEFTQLDMKVTSKNDFMEIIIEFFSVKLAEDNKTIASPLSYCSIEEGP